MCFCAAPPHSTTALILAPNDITSAGWQHPYQGYFGFIYVQWEEAETCRPSIQSMIVIVYHCFNAGSVCVCIVL